MLSNREKWLTGIINWNNLQPLKKSLWTLWIVMEKAQNIMLKGKKAIHEVVIYCVKWICKWT